jgi:hypothetical protein
VKAVAARLYVRVERNAERAAHLDRRQNEAIMDVLRWMRDNRGELRAEGRGLLDPGRADPA